MKDILDAVKRTICIQRRGLGADTGDSPLAGPIYTGEKDPVECMTCKKRGKWMKHIARGESECSHIDCPHRKRYTARGPGLCADLE